MGFYGSGLSAAALKIGLVGKPNVGKSTFFKAATLKDVAIANYPFTTINPNQGIGHIRAPCPHVDLAKPCTPVHGSCQDGTRFVPVELVDVAGLVPGAHEGRGLGNKFLDDLRQADALIHVVDASGATDEEGRPVPAGSHDPLADVKFLDDEIVHWIFNILGRDWDRIFKKAQSGGEKLETLLADRLTGFGMSETKMAAALREGGLDQMALARAIRRIAKPMLVALNKSDHVAPATIADLAKRMGALPSQATSADSEVALRGAAKAGLVSYLPGAPTFTPSQPEKLSPKQKEALDYIRHKVLEPHGGTGVLAALEKTVHELLHYIVVYPVEDETHWTDKKGNILPDAHLIPQGTTARQMAFRVHTDLGEHFIRAIDGRTKRAIGADHVLEPGAVVRIVSNK